MRDIAVKLTSFAIVLAFAISTPIASVSFAQEEPAPQGEGGEPSDDVIKAILIKEGINIMLKNIEASKMESGEIAKLLRAISGVSVRDIEKYGICGGPNSEVRKAFGSLC